MGNKASFVQGDLLNKNNPVCFCGEIQRNIEPYTLGGVVWGRGGGSKTPSGILLTLLLMNGPNERLAYCLWPLISFFSLRSHHFRILEESLSLNVTQERVNIVQFLYEVMVSSFPNRNLKLMLFET